MRTLQVLVVSLLVVLPLRGGVWAQSQDRDHPTPLTSNEISGAFGDYDRRELYYTLTAGPGELSVTLDVSGTNNPFATVTTVIVNFYDQDAHDLAHFFKQSGNNGESEREVQRFKLTEKVSIVLRLTFDGRGGRFRIRFGGDG